MQQCARQGSKRCIHIGLSPFHAIQVLWVASPKTPHPMRISRPFGSIRFCRILGRATALRQRDPVRRPVSRKMMAHAC